MSGAKLLVQQLLKNNINNVFGYAGGTVLSIFDNLQNEKINYYVNTHEQFGCHAATGYAKATNNLGVAIFTSGPSITNAITGILDAQCDSVPLLVISGQVSQNVMGTGAFQEAPSVDLTKPISKWSYMVKNIDELEHMLNLGMKIAMDGRRGAVHLDIPRCVLNASLPEQVSKNDNEHKLSSVPETHIDNNIFELIKNAKRPVILLGNGCKNVKFSEVITKFIKKNKIPVTTTLHGMGLVDENDPLALKFLGMHGSYVANIAMMKADCIIGIGARFDDRVVSNFDKFAPSANEAFKNGNGGIICCNINMSDFNKTIKPHYNVLCDSYEFLKNISCKCNSNDDIINERLNWIESLYNLKWKFDYDKNNELKTQDVICAINKYMPRDTIISTGVGNHQMMAAQYINWRHPFKFLTSGSLGVMGAGLPYAIGAQIAFPKLKVIDIDGDSSLNQSISELATVKKYNLPIKVAVMNDNFQTMVRTWEQLFYKKDYIATACEGNPHYDILANAYEIKGIYCDNHEDLNTTVKYFIDYEGPIMCNFKVKGDKCLPLMPPGKSVDDSILYNPRESFKKNNLIDGDAPS